MKKIKKRLNKEKYYNNIDLLRLLSCIAILLYHLNILKGGYLAVCTFFVLTSYLACISAFKKEKLSLKDYYLKRLTKLYLPLVIVTFASIAVMATLQNFMAPSYSISTNSAGDAVKTLLLLYCAYALGKAISSSS